MKYLRRLALSSPGKWPSRIRELSQPSDTCLTCKRGRCIRPTLPRRRGFRVAVIGKHRRPHAQEDIGPFADSTKDSGRPRQIEYEQPWRGGATRQSRVAPILSSLPWQPRRSNSGRLARWCRGSPAAPRVYKLRPIRSAGAGRADGNDEEAASAPW